MFSANSSHELKGRKEASCLADAEIAMPSKNMSRVGRRYQDHDSVWSQISGYPVRDEGRVLPNRPRIWLLNWVRQCRIGARLHYRTLVWWSQARPCQTSSASQFWMLHRSVSWDLEIDLIDWLIIPNSDLGQNFIVFLILPVTVFYLCRNSRVHLHLQLQLPQ
jgi:hypothetical protein